jgi:hypothetical protein
VQWGDHFALRDQLGLRAEEIQRRELIIGRLTQANAALAARVPELETLRQAKMVLKSLWRMRVGQNGPGRVLRPLSRNASERVPWWRRVLGEGW